MKPRDQLRLLKSIEVIMVVFLFATLTFAICKVFQSSPSFEAYVASTERLNAMSKAAFNELDTMIDEHDVTWDPTNGVEISKVLTNLRVDHHDHVLFIGGSPFLTVWDDRSSKGIESRVDKAFEKRAKKSLTAYNLSLGAQTVRDTKILLAHGMDLVRPTMVFFGLPLVNILNGDVRQTLVNLPPKITRDVVMPTLLKALPAGFGLIEPKRINKKIRAAVDDAVLNHIPFLKWRGAILQWLAAKEVMEGNPAIPSPIQTAAATTTTIDSQEMRVKAAISPGVIYTYNDQEQARLTERALNQIRMLAETSKTYGARAFVVIPPTRPDPDGLPPYQPKPFYDALMAKLQSAARESGVGWIDASRLLTADHFGQMYTIPPDAGKVDVVHFDRAGHIRLAEFLLQQSGNL